MKAIWLQKMRYGIGVNMESVSKLELWIKRLASHPGGMVTALIPLGKQRAPHYDLLNRQGAKDAKVVFLGCKSIVSADTRRSQCLSWRALRLERSERSGRLSCSEWGNRKGAKDAKVVFLFDWIISQGLLFNPKLSINCWPSEGTLVLLLL